MADKERKPKPDVPMKETATPAPPLELPDLTISALPDDSGFDADATLQKLQQHQPAMESASRHDQARQRQAARGQQKGRERDQRLGKIAPDQSSRPVAGPLVDYEGPYQGQQPQEPPNPNVGRGGGNQDMGALLAELQKQTALLTKIVEKIATIGTYGS